MEVSFETKKARKPVLKVKTSVSQKRLMKYKELYKIRTEIEEFEKSQMNPRKQMEN